MKVVEEKVNEIFDPLNHLGKQIDSVYARLREKIRIWKNKKEVTVKERGLAIVELGKIEEDIMKM